MKMIIMYCYFIITYYIINCQDTIALTNTNDNLSSNPNVVFLVPAKIIMPYYKYPISDRLNNTSDIQTDQPKLNKTIQAQDNSIKRTPLRLDNKNFRTIETKLNNKYADIINEIKLNKIDLFGKPDQNMDFYKRNKNVYSTKAIERMTKINKILELEELLEFYINNQANNIK